VYAHIVHISCYCLDRSYGPEFFQDGRIDDITGMKDQVDVLKDLKNYRGQGRHNGRDMGIGDDAYFQENSFVNLPGRTKAIFVRYFF
jgi:hypothetical protein